MRDNVTCLADILSQLGLTSRHLAEILNVHYSLVSKWLNNKRPLKYNSPHLKNLVNALISVENPRQSSALKTILREAYPDADLSTNDKIAVYLNSYLASDNFQNNEQTLADNIDPRHVYAKGKVDIYRKNVGRRDALLRLLDTAIALAPKQELLLFSEETLAWHIDDEDFRKQWLEKYKRMLNAGNYVTMVHTVDRQEDQLLHTITQWLPLHLTGKTKAFYYPEYSNSIFKPSLSILRNQAAMSGVTVTGFSDMLYTYYSSAPHLVMQCELLFAGLLASSRPLFEIIEGDNITKNMLDMAQRRNNSYSFSGLPLNLTLDYKDFCDILSSNNADDEKYNQCTDFFIKSHDFLSNMMKTCTTKQILNLTALEEGVRNGAAVSQFNWIVGGNLFVPPEYFKRGLHGLIKMLEENPNFSLALVDNYALPQLQDVSLLIKENTMIVANSRMENTPSPLIMKEPTIVQAFFKYFTHYWESIPRIQRNRENVIHCLKQFIE